MSLPVFPGCQWKEVAQIPVDDTRINLSDGAGGEMMQRMLATHVLPFLGSESGGRDEEGLSPGLLDDSASVGDVAFTIDGHTIWPLEFPGGDIGRLAVAGCVNDLAVVGARPEAIALSMVIEEGLDIALLRRIAASIGETCREAGVSVVTGDTKVVERGGVKGMVLTTSGIGRRHEGLDRCLSIARDSRVLRRIPWTGTRWLRDDLVRPGDKILLTGSVGDHGISLLSFREGYGYETDVISDVSPLNALMSRAIDVGGPVSAKDLTRGGLSNGLNEWSLKSGCQIVIDEDLVPISDSVSSACEMLGLDPFEIGNEGKAIISAVPDMAEEVLAAIRKDRYGRNAAIIGEVVQGPSRVVLRTVVGGRRIMDPPHCDPVPRIC